MKANRLNRRHKAVIFATALVCGLALVYGISALQAVGIALLGLAAAWLLGSDSRIIHAALVVTGLALLGGPVIFDYGKHRDSKARYDLAVRNFESRLPALAEDYHHQMTEIRVWGAATADIAKPSYDDFDVKAKSFKVANACELDRLLLHLGYDASAREKEISSKRFPLENGAVPVLSGSGLPELAGYLEYEAHEPPKSQENVVAMAKALESTSRSHFRTPSIYVEITDEKNFFAQVPKWYADAVAADVLVGTLPEDQLPGPAPGPFSILASAKNRFVLTLPGAVLVCVGLGLIIGVQHTQPTDPLSKPGAGPA
jgi:hypothetical protein